MMTVAKIYFAVLVIGLVLQMVVMVLASIGDWLHSLPLWLRAVVTFGGTVLVLYLFGHAISTIMTPTSGA
jgi:hypothetical protein